MKKIVRNFFLVFTFLTSSVCFAQSATQTPTELKSKAQFKKKKSKNRITAKEKKTDDDEGVFGTVMLTKNNSLYDHQDATYYDGMNYEVDLGYKWKFGAIIARFSYDQNLRSHYEDQSDVNDSSITYSMKPFGLANLTDTTLSPNLTALIPLSKKSTQVEQLQTAVVLGLKLDYAPRQTVGPGRFILGTGLTFGKNFHRYEVDVNGGALSTMSSNQRITAGYVIENFSLNVAYTHKTRWTYQNNVNEGFELSEELDYEISKSFVMAFGHSNSGAALKANGQDSNFSVVNENDSVIYLQGAFNF